MPTSASPSTIRANTDRGPSSGNNPTVISSERDTQNLDPWAGRPFRFCSHAQPIGTSPLTASESHKVRKSLIKCQVTAVSDLVRRANVVTGRVEGSQFAPYDVTIELHDGSVADTRCSCPYDWGGACKHVVAVLLKFLAEPGEVAERPSRDELLGPSTARRLPHCL